MTGQATGHRRGATGPADIARGRALREAFVLPVLFLTVSLGGGFRAAGGTDRFDLIPPPLVHLVLALLVLAILVRGGVLDPSQVLSARRSGLENVGGAVVIATLFAATAQVLHAVVPDAGLWHLLGVLVLALLLGNTVALRPDRIRTLQSLLVSLGGMLVVKHVVLAGLAAPGRGLARRVLAALLEGVTLGELHVEPVAPSTGYVAFFTLIVYFVGLLLIPHATSRRTVDDGALVPVDGDDSALERP